MDDYAADNLRRAENSAAQNEPAPVGDEASQVRENEETAAGFYSGTGRVVVDKKTSKGFKGFFRKKAPLIAIFLSIFGFGGLLTGVQFFQPFSLVAQFTESFNSMHTSANIRSNVFFRMQMDSGRYKNPIKQKWSIFSGETFKITNKQSARLAAQGIEYDGNYNDTGIRVLKFDDGTGKIQIVTADADSASRIGDGAVDFRKIYADNPDFFNGYNKGSMTWRGAIANWFGTMTAKFLSSNKITRNMFKDFQKKVAEANDGNTRRVAQEIMMRGTEEIEDGGMKVVKSQDEGEDDDGIRRFSTDSEEPDSSRIRRMDFQTASMENNYAPVRNKLNEIGGKVQKGANVACTIMNTMGAISLLVTASEALQIINLTTAYFETVDKVKAGNGDDAPIHVLTNALNTNTINTNATLVYRDGADSSGAVAVADGVDTLGFKTTRTNKTAMQSSGIAALYGGGAVNVNDPSVQSFNPTAMIKKVAGGVGVSMAAFEGCALTKIASNAVTAATDALSVAACIAGVLGATVTFGATAVAGCSKLAMDALIGIGWGIAIGVAVGAVIATITPVVANMLTRDLITELGGEDLGNALTSGANMYLGNTHRSNGGSLASRAKYTEFAVQQQQVIAENAKYERQTRDPFDLTSKYTFMGTLMTQLMSFMSVNSVMSAITSSSSAVSSSLLAMTPSAMAYDISKDLPTEDEYEDTCPYLASIGAIGDAYCNPYSITDITTMGYDPGTDVIEKLSDSGNFLDEPTSDGNVQINGNSDLAKYILFCGGRTSAFGIADQNIVNQVSSWGSVDTGVPFVNNAANSAIGAIPVIGDVIDVVSNSAAYNNVGYVSGESCVAGNTVSALSSPNWETVKYYQRFIEDQSLAESMGVIEESAVTAFLDDYYEKNPLDNSYEGILARMSGLTKDTVVAILDLVEYGNYIANYDPSTRYAFGAPAVEKEQEIIFDNDTKIARQEAVTLGHIIYTDVRNRSFVMA